MVKADPDQKPFDACDFTKREDIIACFPKFKRLQLASRKALPKNVKIEGFTMKTPYGDKVLLENTDLILEGNSRRTCLIGPNCCGKTLLFHNIVHGEIADFPEHLHVHHCKELEPHEMSDTVLGTVLNSNAFRNMLLKMEAKIKELLATPDLEKQTENALKENLDFVLMQLASVGGPAGSGPNTAEDKAIKMLQVLGFDEFGRKKPVSALSGGLKMRVALCMAFFIDADILLLDEPTNHLDFPSVLWLENRLRGYKGTFLIVTHDRELLKNVCLSVILIEDKQLKYYQMGFEAFEKKHAAEDKKKYEDIEKFLLKNKNPSPSTPLGRQVMDKRAWSKLYHDKQVALATKFTFPASDPLDHAEGVAPEDVPLIDLKNVRFSYDPSTGHWIFNDPINFCVTASSRVGVMGPNGAGKSTLLKLLTHKLIPQEGTVTHHPKFKLAYFGQHSTAELDLETTAQDFMQHSFPNAKAPMLRNHLAKTGIIGDVADTRIKGLSYSQRSCIVFAKLTFAGPHLLILDEPTNFLDLESVDSLIGACNKYAGALLLVSHNRDFLKKCAKQFLSVVPGQFCLFNDLKSAEKATYTFIAEMEEGGNVSKTALQNNPGGGTVHTSQKTGDAAPAAAATTTTTTSTTATPAVKAAPAATTAAKAPAAAPKTAAAAAANGAEDFAVGSTVQAKYSADGKWYKAQVKAVKGAEYQVLYVDYGNTEFVPAASVRKFNPPARR
jgi:ATP-binding cassette subfamily F protein 3